MVCEIPAQESVPIKAFQDKYHANNHALYANPSSRIHLKEQMHTSVRWRWADDRWLGFDELQDEQESNQPIIQSGYLSWSISLHLKGFWNCGQLLLLYYTCPRKASSASCPDARIYQNTRCHKHRKVNRQGQTWRIDCHSVVGIWEQVSTHRTFGDLDLYDLISSTGMVKRNSTIV